MWLQMLSGCPTMEVIDKVKTGDRMDFDPEILFA
jgi:hypothetical protein